MPHELALFHLRSDGQLVLVQHESILGVNQLAEKQFTLVELHFGKVLSIFKLKTIGEEGFTLHETRLTPLVVLLGSLLIVANFLIEHV